MTNSTRLGELCEIDVGPAFPSDTFIDHPAGPRLLRGDNVAQGRLRWDEARFWPSELSGGYEKYELCEGDVILAMDRPWIAAGLKQATVRDSDLPALLVQRVARLRARRPHVQAFLRWLVASPAFTTYIRSVSTGSTIPHISQGQIADFPVSRVPEPSEQQAIAVMLGALDDKIEVNRRITALLSETASTRFSCSADQRATLSSVAEVTMGSSPPGDTYNEAGEGLPFYQGVRDFGERSPRLRVWCSAPSREAHAGDTLVAVRAPVGRLNRAARHCAIGRGLAAVAADAKSCVYYGLATAHDAWRPFQGEGTVFAAITAKDLRAIEIRWPNSDRLPAVERELSEIDDLLDATDRESETLAAVRDTLLPEVLSGRLRVPEAEDLVADVG